MALYNLTIPAATGQLSMEQRQMINYIYQMNEQLQYVLNNLDTDNFTPSTRVQFEDGANAAAKIVELTQTQREYFEKLRAEIISNAVEIALDYNTQFAQTDQMLQSLAERLTAATTYTYEETIVDEDGNTVTQEVTKTLLEYVVSTLTQTATDIQINFATKAEVQTVDQNAQDRLDEYKYSMSTYIRFSEVGIEIGKTENDETLPYAVRITNGKMSFLANGVEVAYIQYNKLYISQAEIMDRLAIGNAANGGYFEFITAPTGLGLKWRAG